MLAASGLFRLLGDDARLRLLRLLGAERLNVSELTSILGIAQSGVSRHLGLLRDAGLVEEDREGGFTYYRVMGDGHSPKLGSVWKAVNEQLSASAESSILRADDTRLGKILRLRREHREAHRSGDEGGGQLVPGRSWAAWSRALGLLLPALTVADLGCGEGYLTVEIARWAKNVVSVDRSDRVLERARALARQRRVSNIVWKRGEIERVPIGDEAVDVVFLSQALHHAADPAQAIREAARIVAPGGRVLVLELDAHEQDWVRERLGDRWLGFDADTLEGLLAGAGLVDVTHRPGLEADPFSVIIASGRKRRRRTTRRDD